MRLSLISAAASVVWMLLAPLAAQAQTDAQEAFQQAKAAYQNEQYAVARDLLDKASQTDSKNPDVFLWLGKAHYQLGDLNSAMAAWRQTLKLAPQHAYARQMLDALQLRLVDVDVRIRVIAALLREDLTEAALREIQDLRRSQALDAERLSRVLILEAETLIRMKQPEHALRALEELAIRDPEGDSAQTRLLKGQAKAALPGDDAAQGLALLRAVIADFPDTPQAAAAQYALLAFRIAQGEAVIDELAAWINEHQDHPAVRDARAQMVVAVGVFLASASQQPKPDSDAAVSAPDETALQAARQAYEVFVRTQDAAALTKQIVDHIQKRYVANQAFEAASAAISQLLEMKLPESSRQLAQQALTRIEELAAAAELTEILFALQQGSTDAKPLADWIAAHPDHSKTGEAKRQLLSTYLAASSGGRRVRPAADLNASDRAALAVAGEIFPTLKKAEDALKLTQQLTAHFKTTYSDKKAFNAAAAGPAGTAQAAPATIQPTAGIQRTGGRSDQQGDVSTDGRRASRPPGGRSPARRLAGGVGDAGPHQRRIHAVDGLAAAGCLGGAGRRLEQPGPLARSGTTQADAGLGAGNRLARRAGERTGRSGHQDHRGHRAAMRRLDAAVGPWHGPPECTPSCWQCWRRTTPPGPMPCCGRSICSPPTHRPSSKTTWNGARASKTVS